MARVVVGAGYVGLATSATICKLGHQVDCIDSDNNKICQLDDGYVSIQEPLM